MIDVFRIGVHIGMTTNSSGVLGVLMRDLLKIDGAVSALSKNLGTMKVLAVGAMATFAGTKAIDGIWSMVSASKELNKQLENIKMLGGSAANPNTNYIGRVGEIRERAFATSFAVPQITPAENVKILNEASSQFGIDVAEKLSVKLAQFEAELQRAGKGGNLQEGLKGIDQIGGIFTIGPDGKEQFDAELIGHLLDKMRKGISASGGMLGAQDYLAFAKQAGLSAKQMDSDAIFGYMTEAMIAMGSSRAGTASGSLYQQMVGGTMTQKVAAELKKHGLIENYEVGKGGEVLPNSANIKEKELFEKNSYKWINDVVVQKLQKEGMNPRQILEEISHLFGRQTTQRLAGEMINNAPQFERTSEIFKQAMDIEKSMAELKANDLETNMRALEGAWKGLMQAIGEAGVPAAITIIHGLTSAIVALEQAAANHPDAVSLLLGLSAALAALVAVGGALTVITVALKAFAPAVDLVAASTASFLPGGAGLIGMSSLAKGIGGLLAAVAAHEVLAAVDPHDKMGHWIDRNIPGAAWLDNKVYDLTGGAIGLPREKADAFVPAPETPKVWSRTRGWHYPDARVTDLPLPPSGGAAPQTGTADAPLHVTVTNAGDVGDAAARGTTTRQTRALSRPAAAMSGFDNSMIPAFQGAGGR